MYVGGREAAIVGEMSSGPKRPSGSGICSLVGGVIVMEGVVPFNWGVVWAFSRTWLAMLFKVAIVVCLFVWIWEKKSMRERVKLYVQILDSGGG